MKICVNCLKEIKKNDSYHQVRTYEKGKLEITRYTHKRCQKDWQVKVQTPPEVKQALGMLKGLMQHMEIPQVVEV